MLTSAPSDPRKVTKSIHVQVGAAPLSVFDRYPSNESHVAPNSAYQYVGRVDGHQSAHRLPT